MAGTGFRSLPRKNPGAQCGRSIGLPEWVEAEPGRTFYLWRCMACDYRFESVAYFDSQEADEAIAAKRGLDPFVQKALVYSAACWFRAVGPTGNSMRTIKPCGCRS